MSEEGKLEQDLSQDPLTPEFMCWGSYSVEDGKIIALGWIKDEWKWEWRLSAFDGKKWQAVLQN